MPIVLERPKFLVDLLAEVDGFDAVYQPRDPIEKDETMRGTLTPWLQRAYSLARYYHKQIKLLTVEREYESVEQAANDREIAEMKYKYDALMEIIWACVRAEFELWTEPNIGVRHNFTVIRSERKDDDGFKKLMRAFFERG